MAFARGNSADIYYEVHGRGTPVLLSAGMGGSGAFWEPQLEALAERHQIIVYDHVGTGRSAHCERSIAGMSGDIISVLDHAGVEAAHLVGHAMAGIVGLEFAIRRPARVTQSRRRQRLGPRRSVPAALLRGAQAAPQRGRPASLCPGAAAVFVPAAMDLRDIAHLEAEEERILQHFPPVATMNQRIDMFMAFDTSARGCRRSACRRCWLPQGTMRSCPPLVQGKSRPRSAGPRARSRLGRAPLRASSDACRLQ